MLLLIGDSFLSGVFGRLGYWAPFLVLLGAGAGLPMPEEVTLVGSGYLLHQGEVQFLPIVLVCLAGTLLGDMIPYWVGRLLGTRALKSRFLRNILHPERLALIEQRLASHGNWGVFTCRFLPGLRLPGFFGAGCLGMGFGRFLLVDGLAACLMVPLYVTLGRGLGEHIRGLEQRVQDSTQVLGFVLVLLVVFIIVRALTRRRDRQVAKLEQNRPHGPEEPPFGG